MNPLILNILAPFLLISTVSYIVFKKINLWKKINKYLGFIFGGFIICFLLFSLLSPTYLLYLLYILILFIVLRVLKILLEILKRHRENSITADILHTLIIEKMTRNKNLLLGFIVGFLFIFLESILGFTLRFTLLIGMLIIIASIFFLSSEIIMHILHQKKWFVFLLIFCAVVVLLLMSSIMMILKIEEKNLIVILIIVLWVLIMLLIRSVVIKKKEKNIFIGINLFIFACILIFSLINFYQGKESSQSSTYNTNFEVVMFTDSLFNEYKKLSFDSLSQMVLQGNAHGTDIFYNSAVEWKLESENDSTVKLHIIQKDANKNILESELFLHKWMLPSRK